MVFIKTMTKEAYFFSAGVSAAVLLPLVMLDKI
jgi:hypothetical protein